MRRLLTSEGERAKGVRARNPHWEKRVREEGAAPLSARRLC